MLLTRLTAALLKLAVIGIAFSISELLIANDIDDIKIELKKMQQQLNFFNKPITPKNDSLNQVEINDYVIDEIIDYIEEHEGNLHTSKLKVSGMVDIVYQTRDSSTYKPIFSPQHLYLIFDARLDDYWRVYSELEVEDLIKFDSATGQGELVVDRLYIEYNYSDALNTRLGKFDSPFGI